MGRSGAKRPRTGLYLEHVSLDIDHQLLMKHGRWTKPTLFLLLAFSTLITRGTQASPIDQPSTLKTEKLRTVKVGGKWRIAWDVRFGTVRGILEFRQHADQVIGTFEEYGKTYRSQGPFRAKPSPSMFPSEVPFHTLLSSKGRLTARG